MKIIRGSIVLTGVYLCFLPSALSQSRSENNIGNRALSKTSVEVEKPVEKRSTEIITISPCVGSPYDESNPFRSGMFRYHGDFEVFSSSSHGTTSGCVTTDLGDTHNIASFQDNACFLSNWKVSHGTPEVCYDGKNHFMHIWSGDWSGNSDFEGEGIFYDCPLDYCHHYDFSVWLSSSGTIKKVYFYLASDLNHRPKNGGEWDAESSFYNKPTVTNLQLIHMLNDFNTGGVNNWVKISLPVFQPEYYNMKLWIYTEDDNNIPSSGIDLLFIDEISDGMFGSLATCVGTLSYLSSGLIPPISRANEITAALGAQIASGKFVDFGAGSSINLKPNFKALAGSNFHAHIVPCVNSGYCPTDPVPFITQEFADPQIQVLYPNPASEKVIVKKGPSKIKSISIYDESTMVHVGVSQYTDFKDRIEIDISNLKEGRYSVVIISDKGTYNTRIIVKR